MNQFAKQVVVALALCLVIVQSVAIAQNLGAAPQVNVAVQGQTGAQPEGAFLNFVNWIGNVIAPVGAGVAVLGAIGSYATGRGTFRWLVTALESSDLLLHTLWLGRQWHFRPMVMAMLAMQEVNLNAASPRALRDCLSVSSRSPP